MLSVETYKNSVIFFLDVIFSIWKICIASKISLYMNELNYLYANFIILICVISEKESKTTATQFAYKEALITDMREFVDEFYSEMSVKISSIKREQKREIRDIKDKMKSATRASRSGDLFKQSSEYIVNSNLTISSWASEKQYELHKQLFQLVSESRSQEQLRQ